MAVIASIGSVLQDIFLVDHDDFVSINFDQKSVFSRLEMGAKFDIDQIIHSVGGGAINSATTFARSRHKAFILGSVGQDIAAEMVRKHCEDNSIDSSFLAELPKNTGQSVVLLDSNSGERTILTCRGASHSFDQIDPEAIAVIKPDWVYLTTMGGDFQTLAKVLEMAKKLGAQVAMNPGQYEINQPEKFFSLVKYIDLLILNESEARLMTGQNSADLKQLLKDLRLCTKKALVTRGDKGGVAFENEKYYEFPNYSGLPAVDATGAGDAFGAGFLAAYAQGANFIEAIKFASFNASKVVQEVGANKGAKGFDRNMIYEVQVKSLNILS